MSVRVSSVFVLSCVGSGLATGWSSVQGVLATVCKIHNSRLILMGNRPEDPIRKVIEAEIMNRLVTNLRLRFQDPSLKLEVLFNASSFWKNQMLGVLRHWQQHYATCVTLIISFLTVTQNPNCCGVINFLDIIRRLNLYLKRRFGEFLRNVVSVDRVSPCLQRQGFACCRLSPRG
jgi:hypothetical protein